MKTLIKICMLLTVFFIHTSLFSQTIRIKNGLVKGTLENGVYVFKGIPFALPPIDSLRWRSPQPVKNWTGVLKADKFAPACPQANIAAFGFLDYGMSEDCLYLNIWKPDTIAENLPVIVWLHGGGFTLGSTSQALTAGEELAKNGVIVVSVAYRLGILGFLCLPELSEESENNVSGNYGLLDQICALKWVQENISAFGGDSTNITLLGESAGSQSINILAASPLAKGLFHKAIAMSGGTFLPASETKDRDCLLLLKSAENYGVEFMKRQGANNLDELRKVDYKNFISDPDVSSGVLPPVIDGYVIPADIYSIYEKAEYNDIPMIIGNTSGEGTIFILKDKPRKYEEATRQFYGSFADTLLKIYPKGNKKETLKSMANSFRDMYFGWFTYTWAQLQCKTGKSPVYVYYFNQLQPKSMITSFAKSQEPYHGSDCAYVFGHLEQNPKIEYSEEDKKLSKIMMAYIVNFAKNSNPNSVGLPEWSPYTLENQNTLYLNSEIQSGIIPNIEKYKVIDEYYSFKRNKD